MKKLLLALLVVIGLQIQAQVNYCDSVGYSTQSNNGNLIVNGNSINQIPGTVSWTWTVCNSGLCFTGSGTSFTFNQVTATDTLDVCYELVVDVNGFTYTCMECDSLVYDSSQYNWVLLSIWIPTSIEEMVESTKPNTVGNNKMYDILGREFDNYQAIPFGTIYIQNRKKYIKIK